MENLMLKNSGETQVIILMHRGKMGWIYLN